MSRLLASMALAAAAVVLAASASAAASVRVAVLPFRDEAGDSARAEEAAGLLAAALAARSADIAVRPAAVEAAPGPEPAASEIRRWAAASDVDVVVVGATGIEGEADVTVSASLRWGHSGVSLAEHREVGAPLELAATVDRLATSLADSLAAEQADLGASAAAIAGGGAPSGPGSVAFVKLRKDEPISIESDELEVTDREGKRHLVFSRNVHVVQGDIELDTDRLDAFYAVDESQPERLVATGSVHVRQGERTAVCDAAIYEKASQTVVCSGHAELQQGCDRVRGREIEFNLDTDSVRVIGQASVVIQPKGDDAGAECGEGSS